MEKDADWMTGTVAIVDWSTKETLDRESLIGPLESADTAVADRSGMTVADDGGLEDVSRDAVNKLLAEVSMEDSGENDAEKDAPTGLLNCWLDNVTGGRSMDSVAAGGEAGVNTELPLIPETVPLTRKSAEPDWLGPTEKLSTGT